MANITVAEMNEQRKVLKCGRTKNGLTVIDDKLNVKRVFFFLRMNTKITNALYPVLTFLSLLTEGNNDMNSKWYW